MESESFQEGGNDEDIGTGLPGATEDISIPVMRQTPRTRSGKRGLAEEFNQSLESLYTLLEHEELKRTLLTTEISQETPLAPRDDPATFPDIGQGRGDNHNDPKGHQGLSKDPDPIRLQPQKQDIFFLPVLQGCTETTLFTISVKDGCMDNSGNSSWHTGDVSSPPH